MNNTQNRPTTTTTTKYFVWRIEEKDDEDRPMKSPRIINGRNQPRGGNPDTYYYEDYNGESFGSFGGYYNNTDPIEMHQPQYDMARQNKRDVLSQKSMERTLTAQVCQNPFLASGHGPQQQSYVQDIDIQDRFLKPMNSSFMR